MNLVPKIVFFSVICTLWKHTVIFSCLFHKTLTLFKGLKTKTKVSFASRSSQEGPGSIPDLMSQSNFHPS